jgi:hypothetical protein
VAGGGVAAPTSGLVVGFGMWGSRGPYSLTCRTRECNLTSGSREHHVRGHAMLVRVGVLQQGTILRGQMFGISLGSLPSQWQVDLQPLFWCAPPPQPPPLPPITPPQTPVVSPLVGSKRQADKREPHQGTLSNPNQSAHIHP